MIKANAFTGGEVKDITVTEDSTVLGNLGVGVPAGALGAAVKVAIISTGADWSVSLRADHATSPYGYYMNYLNPVSNTGSGFLNCYSAGTLKFDVASNGNVRSATNSYLGTSDLKLKENIVDAGSQWEDFKKVKFKKYSFKSDNLANANQLGVIAQDLEADGMGGLISETEDFEFTEVETVDDDGVVSMVPVRKSLGTVTKSVNYSVLTLKAEVALQEAMLRIEALEARLLN